MNSNTNYAPYGATLLRITLGLILVAHGLLKVLVFTVPGTVGFFASQGFPGWLAYPVIAGELLGGAALIAGFEVRLVALASLPILLGALQVHAGNGWLFTSLNGGWEYPALLAVLAVNVALLGEGVFAFGNPLTGARSRKFSLAHGTA